MADILQATSEIVQVNLWMESLVPGDRRGSERQQAQGLRPCSARGMQSCMRLLLKWPAWALLLLAIALFSGCASQKGLSIPREEEAALRQRAEFLCQHLLLTELVPSRLPEGSAPSDYIRQQDLDFLQQNPQVVARTDFDVPGLVAALAPYIRCEVTRMHLWKGGGLVHLRLAHPSLKAPRLRSPEVLAPSSPEQRRSVLESWAQGQPEVSRSYLWLTHTPQGWRVSYWLPEQAERDSQPLVASMCTPSGATAPADVSEFDPAAMTPPRLLSGPQLQYTPEAIEKRVRGLFRARCVLTREGMLRDCCILQALPPMDEPILKTLAAQRFQPALRDGEPVQIDYTLNLQLTTP